MSDKEKDIKDRKFRNKVFEVRAFPDKWSRYPDEIEIQYTKNGFQMSSFSLLPEEVDKFIEVLTMYRTKGVKS
jgi:hypothetical protein